jgi:PAS domain S-box-containing protein
MAEKDAPVRSWLMERRYFSLIIVLAFVILSAVTFFLCYRHHAIYTEQTLKEDRAAASLLSLVLDEHLKKLVSVMESYTQRPLLLQAVRDKNAEKARIHLINLKKNNPDVDILIITDRQGTLWAAYPERPESVGVNFAYRDWYKGVSKEWKPNISDAVLRVVEEKDLAVQISIPFVDETGKVIGILTNTQRTVGLSYLFKTVLLDRGAFIAVTDRKDQIVYNSLHDVEKEIKPYSLHPGIKKAMAAKKNTFTVDAPDIFGRTRFISFAPVVSSGWTVFVERDKLGILLSGSAYYIQTTVIAFLLFLSIIFFLFYSRKQVTTQQLQERLQAGEALRASEQEFQSLAEAMPQIVWITRPDGWNIYFNHQWVDYTGLTPEESYGHGWNTPFHPDDQQRAWDAWQNATQNDATYSVECRLRRADGAYHWWLIRGVPLRDANGKILKWFGTCTDIEDIKRAEAALRQESEALQQKAEALRASNDELKLFNLAATGRELRMIELKQEINELCRRLGEQPRHATDPLETDSIPGTGPAPATPGGGGA